MVKKLLPIVLFLVAFVTFTSVQAAAYYTFEMTEPIKSKGLTFSDENIVISFPIGERDIKVIPFILYNKTNQPIKIDWNQISVISPNGTSNKIFHQGILYTDANGNKPMAPTLLPPKANISDYLGLTSGIRYVGSYTGWDINFLFPTWFKNAEPFKNNTFGIFIPLEINHQVKYYSFRFTITNITKEWEPQPYLGILGCDKTLALLYRVQTPPEKGVFIAKVTDDAPAYQSGIKVRDVVIKIAENDINTWEDFITVLDGFKPGSRVKFTILRNGSEKIITVTLGERPKP